MKLKLLAIVCIITFGACDAPAQRVYTAEDKRFDKLTEVTYPNYKQDLLASVDNTHKGVRYFKWLDNALAPFELEKIYLSRGIDDMYFILYHWKSNFEPNARVISISIAKKERGKYTLVSKLPEKEMIIYYAKAENTPQIVDAIEWGAYPAIIIEDKFHHPERGTNTTSKKIIALADGKTLKQVFSFSSRNNNIVKETTLLADEVDDIKNPTQNNIDDLHDDEKEFMFDNLQEIEVLENPEGMPSFIIHTYNYSFDAETQKLIVDELQKKYAWKSKAYVFVE